MSTTHKKTLKNKTIDSSTHSFLHNCVPGAYLQSMLLHLPHAAETTACALCELRNPFFSRAADLTHIALCGCSACARNE